jgi:hypothetical protein
MNNLKTLGENSKLVFPNTWSTLHGRDYRILKFDKVKEENDLLFNIKIQTVKNTHLVVIRFIDVGDEVPSLTKHKVRVNCDCGAFIYTLGYVLQKNQLLEGDLAQRIRLLPPKSKNPLMTPGLCKHLVSLVTYYVDKREIVA